MKKFIIPIVIIVGVIFGAKFLLFRGGPPPGMGGEMPPTIVETANVSEIEVIDKIETTGRIESPDTVNVTASINGHLQKSSFKEGSFVKKGDLLFLIDPNQYEIAVRQAKAGLEEAKAALIESEKKLARITELVEKDYASKAQYDDILATKDRTQAMVGVKQAVLDETLRNLNNTRIRARISGKIGKIALTEGNYVTPAAGPLARIVSMNPIYVSYSLTSEEYLRLVKDKKANNNAEAEIKLPDNSIYPVKGKVVFFDNEINPATGTIDVRAEFQNADYTLIPGQYVNVVMYVGKPEKTLAIAQEAVLDSQEGKYVYILQEDSTVKIRPIKIGKQYEGYWTLLDGLKPGEKIVVKGTQKLRPDMKVMIKEEMEQMKQLGQEKKDGK